MSDDAMGAPDALSEAQVDARQWADVGPPCALCNYELGCLDAALESDAPWASITGPCEAGEVCLPHGQGVRFYACCDPQAELCQ